MLHFVVSHPTSKNNELTLLKKASKLIASKKIN